MAQKTVILAAGGTGGHLFPAEALAEELLARGHNVIIMTDKRGHAFKSLGDRVAIHVVRAGTLRPGIAAKIKAVINMGIGILSAICHLKKMKPDLVVGFGGYPSFPAVFAAQLTGVPTVLHEQNAVLGKANIMLANHAVKIAASLPGTKGIKEKNRNKVIVTGNPVRKNIVDIRDVSYPAFHDHIQVLITGGSQAASVFTDVVPDAFAKLPDDIKPRLRIMQQCREAEVTTAEEKYQQSGINAEIRTFFGDMAARLSTSHLFIGRSGASTVAEIAVAGRPAIFVPYPGHKDMQQKHNADIIANQGGGWVMLQQNFTPETLATKLLELIKHPELLSDAASKAKACGQTSAAKNLADVVESV